MPVGGGKNEPQKKRSQKKRQNKQKSKSKQRITDKTVTINPRLYFLTCFFPIKIYFLSFSAKRCDLNNLTQENLSSLRWDDQLTDPTLENDRIEQYKELRRQRYIDARQQAIQNLVEKMKITKSNK
jgi:hypothetical protein